ncbi:MAG: hypothetical protein H7X83_12345 [Verrucomicrobia bacterium]|nr:hypothetical protein [Deltaproteobacteria bacterium]
MTEVIKTGKRSLQVVSFLFFLLLFTPSAWAAPIPPFGKLAFVFGFMLLERLISVTVTMLLLRTYHLKLYRLAGAYLLVTIILFKLLFSVILPAFGGNLVLGMICEIFLETAALFMLTNLEWFRNDNTLPVLIRTLFLAVVCGNVASKLLSIFVIAPLQFGLLRYLIHPH